MKVLIVSDTHRKLANLREVIRKTQADMLLHMGDIEGQEEEIREMFGGPCFMVAGNNDFFSPLPREEELMIGCYKIWMVHGHHQGVTLGPEYLKEDARAKGVDVVMYGHTHQPYLSVEDDLVCLNPGSISYPRQEGRRPSYAIMDLDRFGIAHYSIFYL